MIGIVGAGITGLSLSVLLEERGVDHFVLEAASRAGGVIRSERVDGRLVDHGPQRTRSTPPVARMIDRLALRDRTVPVPEDLPLFVVRGGRLRRVPFGPGDLFGTDLLTTRGKIRLAAEPWTGAVRSGETVAGLLTRKFGREAYENLLGPLFGGLYGSDPAEMYVRHALAPTLRSLGVRRSILWRFVRGGLDRRAAPPALSFQDGMEELVHAMHDRVAARVRLGNAATHLEPEPGGGWRIVDGSGVARTVSAVILTLPAGEAAELLRTAAPGAAASLAGLRYNPLAMVHLAGDCKLRGLGYQVAFGEPLRTRGVTWNASALGRNGVYTAFLGGARDPGLLDLADEEIGRIASREFCEVTGCPTEVLSVSRTRMPAWDRSWAAMDDLELPAGIHLCSNYESRVGIPGRIDAAERLADQLSGGVPTPSSGGS